MRVTPNGISTSSDKYYSSLQIGAGITINLERRGDIVEATLSGSINSPLSSNTRFGVGIIPFGYRPNRTAYIMVHMTSTNNSSHIDVEPNGICTWWGLRIMPAHHEVTNYGLLMIHYKTRNKEKK